MPLTQFVNKHAGCTAWVFGKGPSVDQYLTSLEHLDSHTKDSVLIAINEAVLVVRDPDYFFCHDGPVLERCVDPWNHGFKQGRADVDDRISLVYPHECTAILRHEHEGLYQGLDAHYYTKAQQEATLLSLSPEKLAETGKLYGESSTTQSACHFAKLIGAARVVLVGIDGGEGIAEVFKGIEPIKGYWYTKNRGDTRRILEAMGMPYEVWEPEHAKATDI